MACGVINEWVIGWLRWDLKGGRERKVSGMVCEKEIGSGRD